jgi:hypothetical protein
MQTRLHNHMATEAHKETAKIIDVSFLADDSHPLTGYRRVKRVWHGHLQVPVSFREKRLGEKGLEFLSDGVLAMTPDGVSPHSGTYGIVHKLKRVGFIIYGFKMVVALHLLWLSGMRAGESTIVRYCRPN